MRTAIPAGLLAAMFLTALPAPAEKADREKEIVVNADKLTADDAKKTSTFSGNVIVTQGTMRMTAATVTVKEDPQHHKYYVANGNPVTFRQKLDNADEWVEGYAQRAEFDDRNDMLRLYDNARVKRDQNEITGNFISYDMRRELAEVTGGPPGSAANGSRVKAVILPPKKGADGDAKADKAPAAKLKADEGKLE
ncbi:MAG TPA: lipopolysaccharide transport periplasmic protein LptA [Usitatibacter sp.]|nr:lipopolysaccharide transport periplasmic protein LptA [Usitatibacter sp.]